MSCSSGCWSACMGGCSSSDVAARPPAESKPNYAQSSSSSSYGCWCGIDCAGCGGCTGGCSGCSGDCTGCSGACGGSCSGTCAGGCRGQCTGTCKTGCQGSCKGECSGGCKEKCTNTCNHLCNSTCVSNVAIDAQKHLKTYNEKIDDSKYIYDIEDWHNYIADDHSYINEGGITEEIFNNSNKEYYYKDGDSYKKADKYIINTQYYLKNKDKNENQISHIEDNTIALDWLDKTEINYLLKLIQEEGRRRKLEKVGTFSGGEHPLTKKKKAATTEESLSKKEKIKIGILDENGKTIQIKSGDFVTDVDIITLNNLLLRNTEKSINLSADDAGIGENKIIKKKAAKALIEKALEAWKQQIVINSTSDTKGVQTVG